jgi:hypothetical protein
LRRTGREAGEVALAATEALVPRRALAGALALSGPAPAWRFLSALKEAAPLDDRRLLVALQLLVESGLLEQ